jgi:hypothetical protein
VVFGEQQGSDTPLLEVIKTRGPVGCEERAVQRWHYHAGKKKDNGDDN